MTREEYRVYMKERRKRLQLEGICVDCGKNKVEPSRTRQPHVCCSVCREARCRRYRQSRLFPNAPSPDVSTARGKSGFPPQQEW